jgi:hypothetical protein
MNFNVAIGLFKNKNLKTDIVKLCVSLCVITGIVTQRDTEEAQRDTVEAQRGTRCIF